MTTIAPYGIYQALDNNGDPLTGGQLFTYEAGTTTPKATFTTAAGDVPNANPVIMDSSGRANVWLGDGGYKFVLKDSLGNTIFTTDNIGGSSDTAFGGTVNIITSNTSITSVYKNSANIVTGTTTLSLLAASAAGEGFYISVKNNNPATNIIIDPDAGELIDGATTKTIGPGLSAVIICDGTQWYTFFLATVSATGNNTFSGNNTFTGSNSYSGVETHTNAVNEAKGADIASAATTNIGAATGNYVHITGTTTITSLGTIQAGTRRILEFDGVLTLTHNATSLILPSGANIVTAAGDVATFVSEGSGNWRCVGYQRANGTALVSVIVDRAYASTNTNTGFTTVIPVDNTIPQNTEGTQILTASITPKTTTNRIRVRFQCLYSSSVAGGGAAVAAFVGSTVNAFAASVSATASPAGSTTPLVLETEYVPGTVSTQVINIRLGPAAGSGTITLNGQYFGGVSSATLILEEITA